MSSYFRIIIIYTPFVPDVLAYTSMCFLLQYNKMGYSVTFAGLFLDILGLVGDKFQARPSREVLLL